MISRETLRKQPRDAVGRDHVLTDGQSTRRFRKGHRTGEGNVLAVVRPGTLLEQWHVLAAAVGADRIVIMQAANTGLTGGSTPDGNNYDREIVLINTLRITGVHLIDEGEQVVCLPGATLDRLEQALAPLGREPHSVIGSSCIGASVLGGVCNNSGGSLVRRGPVYTELALYAQVKEDGGLELVNHLGHRPGQQPRGNPHPPATQRLQPTPGQRRGSRQGLGPALRRACARCRCRHASMPTRHGCSRPPARRAGCACSPCAWTPSPRSRARSSTLAPTPPDDLTEVRRHLPPRMHDYHEGFEHHLTIRMANDSLEETRRFLAEHFGTGGTGAFFECDADEGRKAFLHRFAIAGAAIGYREAHAGSVEGIHALDIALRRNDRDWVETLPAEMQEQIIHKLYYGHFFCHVFHQD